MSRLYHHPEGLDLELGGRLEELTIAYDTYGTPNADGSNTVWVCHALTANSDVADWWPHTVEKGCFLDPEKWFVICANIIGSHYGSTGPLSVNPSTGLPYYGDFPRITIRDMVSAHRLLADSLGIGHIHALVGSSVGGFQAVEWAVEQPDRFGRLILIATDVKATPWTIAIDETQRMAIEADPTFGEPRPDAGMAGLSAARAIGLLTYRGGRGYNLTQQELPDNDPDLILTRQAHRPCSYQQHQGTKLCRRYNAYSYVTILDAFDTHDVGRSRGGLRKALDRLKMPVQVIGITTDMIFPADDMRALAASLPDARYDEIDSELGHDGFLTEHIMLNNILNRFIQ